MLPDEGRQLEEDGSRGAAPRRVSETVRPDEEMVTPMRWPPVVGKLVTEIGAPWSSQPGGTPRPTTREPSDRCATRESSSTLLAPAMPQACGDEPWPVAGCRPDPGRAGGPGRSSSPTTSSGPLWLLAIMNS